MEKCKQKTAYCSFSSLGMQLFFIDHKQKPRHMTGLFNNGMFLIAFHPGEHYVRIDRPFVVHRLVKLSKAKIEQLPCFIYFPERKRFFRSIGYANFREQGGQHSIPAMVDELFFIREFFLMGKGIFFTKISFKDPAVGH